MKKLLVLFSIIAVVSSCSKKDDDNPTNNNNNSSTIRFTCTSSNPYDCYIDGVKVYDDLPGSSHYDATTTPGSHTVKAVQQSGYVFTPTIRENSVYAPAAGNVEFIFP